MARLSTITFIALLENMKIDNSLVRNRFTVRNIKEIPVQSTE